MFPPSWRHARLRPEAPRHGENAIDWIRSDDEGHIELPDDNSKPTDFPAYCRPIISVANGKAVDVVDEYPDEKPGVLDPNLTLKDAGGTT